MLLMLLIAAAVPIAAVAAMAALTGGSPKPAAGQNSRPRRTTLSVAALLALVATLVPGPVHAAEGDMHVFSGTVTDTEGAPLADIVVSVFCQYCDGASAFDPSANPNPARPWPADFGGATLLGEATTDGAGNWSVTAAEPSWAGFPLVVAWDPDAEYALNGFGPWELEWASHSDLAIRMADGGRLSGRILADGAPPPATNGWPPPFTERTRFELSGPAWPIGHRFSLVVAADGSYRTPGLPDGQYGVSYLNMPPGPYATGAAFPLGAISEGEHSTADHSLVKYTSVSGRVTDADGRALSGIRVVTSPVGTSAGSLVATPFGGGEVVTAADGTYSIDTVPGIAYQILFTSTDGSYASEYYNDRTPFDWGDRVETPAPFFDGDRVEIPAEGAVTGIDAQLALGGNVSGQVRDADGEPNPYAWVSLCLLDDSYSCWSTAADESGFYEFRGVAPSVYTLQGGVGRCVTVGEGKHVEADLVAGATQGGFVDVPPDAYYSEPVGALAEQGVFTSTELPRWSNGFCPDAPIDRKTMAVWVVRVLDGEDPEQVDESRFDDVPSWWFEIRFIERMADLGITTGCGDGTNFCPDDTVTRAQMAVFLSRAYSLPEGPDQGFADVPDDAWYAADVARLAAAGITSGCGDGTNFCPGQDTTRAQMATFLWRAQNRAN